MSSFIGMPLTIGPRTLETNVLLAPVANYCDLAFRIVARSFGGVGLACTDLLSPHGVLRGNQQSMDLARTDPRDQPLCMQLYGRDPELLSEAARWAVDQGAATVDINMGCPVDKVAKKNGGSLLLRDPCSTTRLAERVAKAVREQSGDRVPTTAKVRLGWDDRTIVAPALARDLERAGIAMVTVHGRTTEQRFKGTVRTEGIAEVVAAVEAIPVLGNGDIKTPEDALAMMRATGCAGVMIGRGAFSRPWLMRDIWAAQRPGAVAPTEPSEGEKIDMIERYFELMREFRGDRYALAHIRRRISWFSKTLGPCKPLKVKFNEASTIAEIAAALDAFRAGGLRAFPAPVADRRRAAQPAA
jgi:tRNA-dihydrouridine synthase B